MFTILKNSILKKNIFFPKFIYITFSTTIVVVGVVVVVEKVVVDVVVVVVVGTGSLITSTIVSGTANSRPFALIASHE
ncbi:hypothetical protein BpHYR1_023642 [Brachionus plicatilis]|uniref:Uncharacterized protein n=1 Tax=Brachionus plicatilis TaxID=10195 RepID=A0A3M7RU06_BRAPC|nr:hypothetical protein BpHYR1_023642 [Brachionus plicatilis]